MILGNVMNSKNVQIQKRIMMMELMMNFNDGIRPKQGKNK